MNGSTASPGRAGLAALFLVCAAAEVPAQAPRPSFEIVDTAAAGRHEAGAGRAFLYSLALPGAGQYRLGAGRWAPYASVEAWAWLRYLDRRQDGRDLEGRYRDLAWSVARRVGTGPRRDGDFRYYEALGNFAASGAFDRDAERAGVQPEADPATFNGSVWALARAIYFPADTDTLPETAPEYREALEYYRSRAVRGEFAWSWEGHGPERETYGELIEASDGALRSATRALGLILANHVVSAVDALITARLSGPGDADPPIKIESDIEFRGAEPGWMAIVRISWPRR